MLLKNKHSRIQKVQFSGIENETIEVYVKREDELHPFISGNKYRKLKYNLEEAKKLGHTTLLTFGGAFSNHIAAAAAAGFEYKFNTVGVIRGDELQENLDQILKTNPTLKFAHEYGMKFHFVSRSDYRNKTSDAFLKDLDKEFGRFYFVPEGGTNALAVKGCEEILNEDDRIFDVVCSSSGTGGTISGIINSLSSDQRAIGFSALKGDFLKSEIAKYVLNHQNWSLNTEYHFGGYAKINADLISFINEFKVETGIPLDPVYTGKMMYGLVDMINKGYFENRTKILAIHTGGLQGIAGMNKLLLKKGMNLIQ